MNNPVNTGNPAADRFVERMVSEERRQALQAEAEEAGVVSDTWGPQTV